MLSSLIRGVVLLSLGTVTACSATETDAFRSAPEAPLLEFAELRGNGGVALVLERRIGRAEGSDTETFGFVGDAVFGEAGSIYVADPMKHRVTHVDSHGGVIRVIGRKGAGPGEMLAPTRLAYRSGELAVFDQTLGRITVFDTAGRYRHQLPFPAATLVGDVLSLAGGRYAFTTSLPPAAPMAFLDRAGRLHPVGIRGPASGSEAELSGGPSTPGSLCLAAGDTLLYANPWIHEIVALPADGERAYHSWLRPSGILRPVESGGDQVGSRQNATLLGLACDRERVVLAYMVTRTGQLYYDLLSRDGDGIGQLSFDTASDTLHPGFVGDLEGSRLLTFRGRPYPQLLIFNIREDSRETDAAVAGRRR